MNLQRIALSHLIASAQPRPLQTAEVDKLVNSIREVGLIQPITVTPAVVIRGVAEPGWRIVAGHHRVAACRALGWTEIDAIVIDQQEHLQNELIEIDENLCRAELSTSQRTMYTKRRKQIWEALHPPESKQRFDSVFDALGMQKSVEQVGTDFPPVAKHGHAQEKGFAASTAEATGMTKRSINQQLARAEALGDETLAKVSGTSLDSGVELDALAKLPEPERAVLVERASAGERVSAKALPPPAPPAAPKAPDAPPSLADVAESLRHAVFRVLEGAGLFSPSQLSDAFHGAFNEATDDEQDAICDVMYYFDDVTNALSEITFPNGRATTAKPAKKPKGVPVAYRGPNGETWSGRGKEPRWVTAWRNSGGNMADILVDEVPV